MPTPPRLADALLSRTLPGGLRGRTILGDLRQEFDDRARADKPVWVWYWVLALELSGRYTLRRILRRDGVSARTASPRGRGNNSGGDGMGQFITDLRYGLRMILRTPLLSAAAILTIGLGVGLTSHTFSVVYGSVIRGPDIPAVDRLMVINRNNPVRNSILSSVPYLDFLDLQAQQTSFEELGGFYFTSVNLAGEETPPESYAGAVLSANVLSMTGVRPILGRGFVPGEDGPDADRLVVLSHGVWHGRFAGDPEILGRGVRLDGESYAVIGVMPEGFGFPFSHDLWITHRLGLNAARGGSTLDVLGRLREGVTVRAASEEVAAINDRLRERFPETNADWNTVVMPFVDRFMPSVITNILVLMLGAVFGVLLIASANVANLLLARATLRGREVAVRTAMGASRRRIVRQLLSESVVLGLMGGVLGLALAWVGVVVFNAALVDIERPYWIDIRIDAVAMAFTFLVTLVAAVVAGTVPAVKASGTGVAAILKDESRGSSSLRLGRFSSSLVVTEVAVSCALLIMSGLMVKGVVTLRTMDMGFSAENVLVGSFVLKRSDYPEAADRGNIMVEFERQLRAESGVQAVTFASYLPGMGADRWAFGTEGQTYATRSDYPQVNGSVITSAFFETFEIPIIRGRAFDSTEDAWDGEPLAIVSRSLADRFFSDRDVLGERIKLGRDDSPFPYMRIVGVAADVHTGSDDLGGLGSDEVSSEQIYVNQAVLDRIGSRVAIRTAGAPVALAPRARAVLQGLDPNLPLFEVMSMETALAQANWAFGLFGSLFTIFGIAALFLATVGLYGVIAFSVGRRRREMGVRMALGARANDILGLVLRGGTRQLLLGMLLGVGLGAALSQPMGMLLFDVEATDPIIYLAIVATLGLTGLVATLVPALRATRVDPNAALRSD